MIPTPTWPEPPGPQGDRLGIVAGSGLTGTALADTAEPVRMTVAGADGSDVEVRLEDGGRFVLLRRHDSIGEHTPAHLVDHHANIRALCAAGCDRVLALSSVGSLRADWVMGTVVVPDDFLAFDAYPTFFRDVRGHSVPGFDEPWRRRLVGAWKDATGTAPVDGGTYAQTRGPRFETPAEVRLLAHHADLVGMTVASEAVLAREAGLAYAAVCKVDNLANGLDEGLLTVDEYAENAAATAEAFATAVRSTVEHLEGTA